MADLTTATFAECRDTLAKKTNKSGKPFSSDPVKKFMQLNERVRESCFYFFREPINGFSSVSGS